MSFIKIKDPKKREELIKDFIETRKRIKSNFLEQKIGEIGAQRELAKFFKPVTETQKETSKEFTEAQKAGFREITEAQREIKDEIAGLPVEIAMRVVNRVYPALDANQAEVVAIGPIAVEALILAFQRGYVDYTFGLQARNRKFYFGDKELKIRNDDIEIGAAIYDGTHGLWNLIISQNPDENLITDDDYEKYKDLNYYTNNLYRDNNPYSTNHKGNSRGNKWNTFLKPMWVDFIKERIEKLEQIQQKTEEQMVELNTLKRKFRPTRGTGLTQFIPSDPTALTERLKLLLASLKAGHSNVNNEIVSITDELKRQGIITTPIYKKLNHLIKNDST